MCSLCCSPHVSYGRPNVLPTGAQQCFPVPKRCSAPQHPAKTSAHLAAVGALHELCTDRTLVPKQCPTDLCADQTLALQTSLCPCRRNMGLPRSSRGAFPSVGGSSCRMRPKCSWCQTRPRTPGEAAVLCADVSSVAWTRQALLDVAAGLAATQRCPASQLCCTQSHTVLAEQHLCYPVWLQGLMPPKTAGQASPA